MRTSTNPTGLEVNDRIKPSMILRGLELGTIGLNPKALNQLRYLLGLY